MDLFDYKIIINEALADILAAIIIFILTLVFLDRKRVLAPWLYKFFGVTFTKYLYLAIKLLVHPLLRILLAFVFLIFINYRGGDLLLSSFVLFILLSFLRKQKYEDRFLPVGKISDDFQTLDNWEVKTGEPEKETNFGNPAPTLRLKKVSGQRTNSFVILKNILTEEGIIECDFYLEQDALLNIVFFCDKAKDNWYMARFDSRGNYSDGFLIKNQGLGVNWRNFRMSGTQTSAKKWWRARVEFDSTRVAVFRDGELLVEFNNPQILGGSIGLFNEVNHVYIDNFSFIEKM